MKLIADVNGLLLLDTAQSADTNAPNTFQQFTGRTRTELCLMTHKIKKMEYLREDQPKEVRMRCTNCSFRSKLITIENARFTERNPRIVRVYGHCPDCGTALSLYQRSIFWEPAEAPHF